MGWAELAHAFNPSTREDLQSEIQDCQLGPYSKFQDSQDCYTEKSCLKTPKKKQKLYTPNSRPLWSVLWSLSQKQKSFKNLVPYMVLHMLKALTKWYAKRPCTVTRKTKILCWELCNLVSDQYVSACLMGLQIGQMPTGLVSLGKDQWTLGTACLVQSLLSYNDWWFSWWF